MLKFFLVNDNNRYGIAINWNNEVDLMVNHPASLILNISIVLLKLYHLRKVKAILEVVDGSQMHQRKHLLVLYNLHFSHSQIQSGGYILERRENIEIKGKGIMDTYFLNGKLNDFDSSLNICFTNDHQTTSQPMQFKGNPSPPTKPQSGATLESSTLCSII